MLERAASRLETAGRRFLRDSNGAIRTRRTLSRHFWKHNGSGGDADRWYLALVQPPPGSSTYPASEQSLGSKMSNDAVLPFLDFLYPRETQEYANLRLPSSPKRLGLRRRKRTLNSFQRTYTSETSNIHRNSVNNPEQLWELKETDETGETEASVQAEKDLFELLQTTERTDILFDKAWVLYLAAYRPSGARSALIEYLKSSQQTVDRDRAWELFENLAPESRSEQDFLNITISQLSCKKPSKLNIICEQAVSRGVGNVCCQLSFVYYVNHHDWVNAQEIWDLRRSPEQPDRWQNSRKPPPKIFITNLDELEICDDALSLGDFLSNQPDNASLRKLAYHFINRIASSLNILEMTSLEILLQLLDQYQELHILEPRHYFAMIESLQSTSRSSLARSFVIYRHMRRLEPDLKPSEKFFDEQLQKLKAFNMTDSVRFFLDECTFFHQRPSSEQFRVAMIIFSRAGDVEQTNLLFEKFIARYGTPKNPKLITPLLHAHARNDDLPGTIELFKRISEEFHLKPITECWNILIAAYMSRNDLTGAFSTYSRMLKAGVNPNSATITTLMGTSASRGDVESVQRLLIEAREQGVSVTMDMLQPIVHVYFINGRLDLAERFCYTCMKFNIKGSPMRTLNSLLMQYAFKVDYTSFYRVLEHMKNAGLEADGTTYAAIMLNMVLSDRPDMARQTLRRLHRRHTMQATEFHYAIILLGYLKIGNLEMVHIIFHELSERFSGSRMLSDIMKLSPELQQDPATSQKRTTRLAEKSLLNIISQFDITTVASKFVSSNSRQEALSKSFNVWDVENLIKEHGDKGAIEQAISVFDQYVSGQSSVASSGSSYYDNVPIRLIVAMMMAHSKAGQFEKVEEFWQLTLSRTIKMAIPIDVDELLKQADADNDTGLASLPVTLNSPQREPKILPSQRFYMSRPLSIYMRTLASRNELQKISEVVHEIEAAGFALSTFNRATWVQVLSDSDRLADIKHALRMFEEVFMPNFPGWDRLKTGQGLKPQGVPRSVYMLEDIRKPEQSKHFLGKTANRYWSNIAPGFMQPTYVTVIHIAAALNRIRERSILTGSDELQRLYDVAPLTMDVIAQLPYMREKVQGVLLRQRSDQSEYKKRRRRITKIGLAREGILGRRVDTTLDHDLPIKSDLEDTLAPADIIDMQREIRLDRKLRTQRNPQASSEVGYFEQTSTRKVYMPPAQKIVYSSRITQRERVKRSERKRQLMLTEGEEDESTTQPAEPPTEGSLHERHS
ncbi:hypothetical protein N7495_005463 [Penicillium taxi]|uniref:uncharacterized protein n=1 Tax=Penicillium taxi TaxID=168475 RepID=UPI0025456255|nr:uncharacterized protein N7495_005463 [Penicillium taxi]KAJ5893772.1 hypothetical protein N7495_005463 [Penicillium taxi]